MTDESIETPRSVVLRADRQGIADHSSSRFRRALVFASSHGVLEVLRRANKLGLRGTLNFVVRNIRHSIAERQSRLYDSQLGIDTAGSLQLHSLTIASANREFGNEAVSTSPKSFAWMMRAIGRPLRDYTFIDIGCGKGRTLILALDYGFKHVAGVEFAAELVAIARANIASRGSDTRANVTVLHEDATQYEFPRGPLVVYLYNPFGPEVFRKVLNNLLRSLDATSDDCVIVYGSSRRETLMWARGMILESGKFDEVPAEPMPTFLDAVRTIEYVVFRFSPGR